MLPKHIDHAEPHRFVINDSRGFYTGFFHFAPGGSQRPVACHWMRECGDKASRDAMVRWLCVRRSQWQQWGRLAQAIGPEAFADHMEKTMTLEPIEPVIAASVQKLSDPSEVSVGELLAGADGLRAETLYVHKFGSTKGRTRFLDWLFEDISDRPAALVKLAFDQGTSALGALMDKVAVGQVQASKSRSKGRRTVALSA